MPNSTSNTYTLKRDILKFANKISEKLTRPDKKFVGEITYGMLASNSCLLTDIIDTLHEKTKKINSVERLTRHLKNGIPDQALDSYLNTICKWCPTNPIIHIDDSDVVKHYGEKFEHLDWVRDGSKSNANKNVYDKGYHVTEATVLTESNHPVSVFSEIHSVKEKDFTSMNHITFSAMERGANLFKKATFVMDRGYDDNKMFQKLTDLGQDYVIRLKSNRKLFYHNKWVAATELRNRRKGKLKLNIRYKEKIHSVYISHVKVQITASKQDIYLVLVYGITESPMMLATNKMLKSKDDVIRVARNYFSRWRIEEYFRSKKNIFKFEDFRVRSLIAINSLNFYITLCMAFLAHLTLKSNVNHLKQTILKEANAIKEKVNFSYYRLAKGTSNILAYAREGVRLWFKPDSSAKTKHFQICLPIFD